jgi:ubiquinone/menaquinone biosynthesis C-methylase UbiE
MGTMSKDWDRHVVAAEDVARGDGFRALERRIVELSGARAEDVVLDVGAGTGLLTLALAPHVRSVWALDIAPAMIEYLRVKVSSSGLENVEGFVASAVSVPLVDETVDVVVSNYCLHHLDDNGKRRALAEIHRVLKPGGRVVIGDMMFGLAVSSPRDRAVVSAKVRAMLRMGVPGVIRLLKNAGRLASRRWENPATPDWWRLELPKAGFVDVEVETLEHEGGLVWGLKPR